MQYNIHILWYKYKVKSKKILKNIYSRFNFNFLTCSVHQFFSSLLPVSPIIVTSAGEVISRIGDSAVLPCRAVGILPITYTWTRGRAETNSLISPTEDRHISGESLKAGLEHFCCLLIYGSHIFILSSKHEWIILGRGGKTAENHLYRPRLWIRVCSL